jgi:hypothetical protein
MITATNLPGIRSVGRGRPSRGLICHELVYASGTQSSGLPSAFRWRGRRYRIAAVDGSKGRSATRNAVRIYLVRTTSGMRCELEHRTESNVWMMNRVLPSL